MWIYDWAQLLLFSGLVIFLVPVLGTYMANVFTGQSSMAIRLLGWLEKLCYQIGGVNAHEEMTCLEYGKTLFLFNVYGFIGLFLLLLLQGHLFLNPQHFEGLPLSLAFNIAASFVTNTDWQSYSGETTLSYLTQMLGLTSQNFLSAATGMATFLVLTRGLVRKTGDTIGNFWEDLVRMIVYILIPLSIILALILISQGVIQTLNPYVTIQTIENIEQTIPLGPVASQEAIKQLGSNGGGFFNANSTHPFENPNLITNFLEMFAIILIPAATVYSYGLLIGSKKHSQLLFLVMVALWAIGMAISVYAVYHFNHALDVSPVLEGKEVRIHMFSSIFWTTLTTSATNGSINAMISSLAPLVGAIAMFNMMTGGLIWGGIGVGMCSMIMFILLTVFLSGLMVGRTPEYLGKKIEIRKMQWVTMAILSLAPITLIGASFCCILPEGLKGISNRGPHGLSEILYTFTSCASNNGSAFAGLNANTPFYNWMLGIVMLLGRAAVIVPSIAVASFLLRKKLRPPSAGTFSTNSVVFAILLGSVVMIVGALTFFPAQSLGPIVEHILMNQGKTF